MKKPFLSDAALINITKWWLTVILILLPLQQKIVKVIELWSNVLSTSISYLDEVTIVIFFPLAIREFYKRRESPYLLILFPLIFLSVFGFISGMINGNSVLITILGIFDYIKNFLVIFLYAVFFRDFKEFKRNFRLLVILTITLGVIAFAQEFWALFSRYIIEQDIKSINYFLAEEIIPKDSWMFGIYRAPSLMHSHNIFGMYTLLILTIYLFIPPPPKAQPFPGFVPKRWDGTGKAGMKWDWVSGVTVRNINFIVLFILFTGVFVSVSRIAYTGLIFIIGAYIFRNRKRIIILSLIPVIVLSFLLGTLPVFDKLGTTKSDLSDKSGLKKNEVWTEECKGVIYRVTSTPYRIYARDKAIEVWKDHPFLGVGPGMFGGVVSVIFKSPVYKEYDFFLMWVLEGYRSLDQFWPQALAEIGVIGALAFIGLLISLFTAFFKTAQQTASEEIKGLFTGLQALIIVLLIYFLGNGLNNAAVLFTFSAFAGMGLGSKNYIIERSNV
jgi:hypothetical protein